MGASNDFEVPAAQGRVNDDPECENRIGDVACGPASLATPRNASWWKAFRNYRWRLRSARAGPAASRPHDAAGTWSARMRAFASKGALLAISILLSIVFGSRDPRYITDTSPPTGRETYAEVMPATVAGQPRLLHHLPAGEPRYRAVRATYGAHASLDIVQSREGADWVAYIEAHIVPRLAAFKPIQRRDGTRWRWHGRNGEARILAWRSGDWLFVIEAVDQDTFDELTHQFRFVRHE